ncbi:MAG: hypothetical protein ABR992_20470 [Solirubrobacteraceae bacterium]
MVALVGGALAVVALIMLGSPGEVVGDAAIVAGAAVGAVLFTSAAELVWAWLQAPMRLLTADVLAIRERVEAIPSTPPTAPEPPFNMRYSLLNSIRLGEKLSGQSVKTMQDLENWAAPVVRLLTDHAAPLEVEHFLRSRGLEAQIAALETIVKNYP